MDMELVCGRRTQRLEPRRTIRDDTAGGVSTAGVTLARLIAPFALVLSAAFFCAIVLSVWVRQADERHGTEQRAALQRAIDDIRSAGSLNLLRELEQNWGLKGLRAETEPALDHRAAQPVIDGNGRIVGWFNWEPHRPMTEVWNRLRPLTAVIGLALLAFAMFATWLVRRSARDLAASERRAWKLAHEDALTGLPNRRKLLDLADLALEQRPNGQIVAFICLGLESFQSVKEALGRRGGDRVLVEVAQRLRAAFPGAVVGRFGGDEFAIVMTGADRATAIAAAEAAVTEITKPYWIDQAVRIGASAGLAQSPRDGTSRDELIRRADLALRAAKRHSGRVVAFEPAIEAELDQRCYLERELRRALADGALDVQYQPIVTAEGTRVVGVEARARWMHPSRGAIPPSVFVPIAEQTGMMAELGELVLRRAFADAERWPDLSIAVNLYPAQLRDRDLIALVTSLLHDSRLAPERVVLEVTEGILIDNTDEATAQLGALRMLGIEIALQDFGTGYSSLSCLQRLPIDKIKIDKSFLAPLGRSQESGVMMQAMVGLGRALGLTVAAEGVEIEKQRVLLRMAGCNEMQGSLFAQAGPREAVDRLLAAERQAPMTAPMAAAIA
jgi:diguanylate cyclase (GGDEF)-like protein